MGIITELSTDATHVTEAIVAANQIYGQRFLAYDTSFYQAKYTVDAVIYPVQHPMVLGRDSIGKYYYDGGKNKKLRILIKAMNITCLLYTSTIALASFVNCAPRFWSFAPFWRLIVDHFECPLIIFV